MDKDLINEKMKELEEGINHKFKDLGYLAKAMYRKRIPGPYGGKNNRTYENEYLALLGDAIITIVLSEFLHDSFELKSKGEITEEKKALEGNNTFYEISISTGLINYAYNENHFYDPKLPDNEKVSVNEHDTFIEAIVGAIYKDEGFDAAKEWILTWLLDKLSSKLNNLKIKIEFRKSFLK